MVNWKREVVAFALVVLLIIPTDAFFHSIEDYFNWIFGYWDIRGWLLFAGCFLYIRLITMVLDWLRK